MLILRNGHVALSILEGIDISRHYHASRAQIAL